MDEDNKGFLQKSVNTNSIEESQKSGLEKLKEWSSQNIYLVATVVTVTVVVLTIIVLLTVLNDPKQNEIERINEEEKEEILTEVISNNTRGILAIEPDVLSINADGSIQELEVGDPNDLLPQEFANPSSTNKIPVPQKYPTTQFGIVDVSPPNIDVYNYRHSTTTIVPGLAAGQCGDYYNYNETRVNEYYDFFDYDYSSHKNVEIGESGKIYNYHIGQYGDDINEHISYNGGKIAGRTLYAPYDVDNSYRFDYGGHNPDIPSYPVSYSSDYVLDLFMYEGNAQITDFEDVDGVRFYDVTTISNKSCNSDDPYTPTNQIITIYKVNSETYDIVETKRFLDRIDESALLFTETMDVERKKVARSEVSNDFLFSEPATFVDVDYRNYTFDKKQEKQKLFSYLDEQNVEFTTPDISKSSDKFGLSWYTGIDFPERVQNERYYLRKDYYPNTKEGRTEHRKLLRFREKQPWVTFWFDEKDTNETIMVRIFDAEKIGLNAALSNVSGQDPENTFRRDVRINGELMSAKVLENLSSYVTDYLISSYPASFVESYPIEYGSYPVWESWYWYIFKNQNAGVRVGENIVIFSYNGVIDDYIFEQRYRTGSETNNVGRYNRILQMMGEIINAGYYSYY